VVLRGTSLKHGPNHCTSRPLASEGHARTRGQRRRISPLFFATGTLPLFHSFLLARAPNAMATMQLPLRWRVAGHVPRHQCSQLHRRRPPSAHCPPRRWLRRESRPAAHTRATSTQQRHFRASATPYTELHHHPLHRIPSPLIPSPSLVKRMLAQLDTAVPSLLYLRVSRRHLRRHCVGGGASYLLPLLPRVTPGLRLVALGRLLGALRHAFNLMQ
jgi:hypothetical protein